MYRGNGNRRGKKRGSGRMARFGVASLVVVMLAMALMPLTSTGVSAARDDFKINSQVMTEVELDVDLVDPSIVDPTPEPTKEIDDFVVAEIDPEVIDDFVIVTPEGGTVGTIQINKQGCQDDYEGDYNQLAANCEPMGAPFTVFTSAGELYFDGSFTASDLPAGDVWVVETVPDGFGLPIVFCNIYAATGAESGFFQAMVDGGSVYFPLEAGSWIYCDWYNVPTEWEGADEGGTITIVKWYCPAFEAVPVDPELEFYLENCTQTMDGVEFTVDYPAVEGFEAVTKSTGESEAGTVQFDGLEAGELTITETIPSGYGTPLVFCSWGAIYDEDGDGVAVAVDGLVPATYLEDGTLDFEMLPNGGLYCNWFNFEDWDDDIIIYKYDCPEGWDYDSMNLDELMVECSQPMSGIDFTLSEDTADELDILVDVQNTDENGYAAFEGVGSGSYHVTEAIPSGYGTPIVYCGPIDGEFNGYPVTEDGLIGLEFGEYGTIICHWFNIPRDDDGSITIYKYTCPAGYEPYADWADPVHDCTEVTNGIDFTITGEIIADNTQTTGDVDQGAVEWYPLEEGTYGVIESVPAGYFAPYVICQWYEDLGPFHYEVLQPYNAAGGAGYGNKIDLELYAGTHIICKWFNVPMNDNGELVVIKYWCDGHIYNESACELYGGGADFEIDPVWGGASVFITTGWDGTAGATLEAGEYDLYELDRDWCKAESDQVNDDGHIVVQDGETSYVTVYNCGPGKEKEPPVKKFPNTGVAPDMMDSGVNGGMSGLMAILAIAQVGAVLVLRATKLSPMALITGMRR